MEIGFCLAAFAGGLKVGIYYKWHTAIKDRIAK
jgi:hypothetical protein